MNAKNSETIKDRKLAFSMYILELLAQCKFVVSRARIPVHIENR